MRKEQFFEGEYYHVYNRGVEHRDIFLDDHDRTRFLHAMYVLNFFETVPNRFNFYTLEPHELLIKRSQPLVRIVAACFMTNHFHCVLSPVVEKGVSRFLHKIGVSYGKYFNTRYERTGRLFESTFQAKHIDSQEYAEYITEYIHLNPHSLSHNPSIDFLIEYAWSSLSEYVGRKGKFSLVLDTSFRDDVLGMKPDEYRNLCEQLLLNARN